jgi:hypothetical protein
VLQTERFEEGNKRFRITETKWTRKTINEHATAADVELEGIEDDGEFVEQVELCPQCVY